MCECISYAAENVLRSQITSSALEKIDEKVIKRKQKAKPVEENMLLINTQKEIEKNLTDSNYTFDDPKVILNSSTNGI